MMTALFWIAILLAFGAGIVVGMSLRFPGVR
jgi:hypothetical protein